MCINEETFFYNMCQVLIHIRLQTSRTIFKLEFLSIPSWTLLQPKISEIKSEKYFFQSNLAIMRITGLGDKVTKTYISRA